METSTWLEAFKSHWIQAEKAMMAVHPLMELQKGPNFAQNGKATGQQPISGDLVIFSIFMPTSFTFFIEALLTFR